MSQPQNVTNPKSNPQSGFGHDSLRFSYDFNRQSSASSLEGKQIQFQFEEYPEHESQADPVQKQKDRMIDCGDKSSSARKLGIFNKYRHNRQSNLQTANDIGQSFDKIFKNDKSGDITTKYFEKKQQREEREKQANNGDAKQTQVPQSTGQSNKKQQEIDIFDKIVQPHKEGNQNEQRQTQQMNNHESFDPFSQSYLKYRQNSSNFAGKQTQGKCEEENNSMTNQVQKSKIKQTLNSQKDHPSSMSNQNSPQFILNDGNPSSTQDHFVLQQNSNAISTQVHHDHHSSQTESQKIFMNNQQTINCTDPSMQLPQPLFEQEQRVVQFLCQIRKMNSIYPNFNHPNINLPFQQKFCNSLACLFEQALVTLQKTVLLILEKWHKPRFFPKQFRSLQYFTTSGWQIEKLKEWDLINQNIKPKINLRKASINEPKIMKALMNYREVIEYYKEKKVELNNEQQIKSYFKIREKFWQLQKNMRGISQDIYQIYPSTHYPQFYFNYLHILKSSSPSKDDLDTLEFYRSIHDLLIGNQQKNEPLSISEVGQAVKMRIQKELGL